MHLARIEASGTTQSRTRRTSLWFVSKTLQVASRFALAATVLASLTGCGNNFRPVLSAINPVGPAAQPQKFAVVISAPSPTSPGLVTFVDFAGDTVLVTANIGVMPYYLILDSAGTTGYTLNQDSTLTNFSISTQLLSSQVLQTTLLNNNNVLPLSIFPQGTFTYVTQPGRNSVAEFQSSPLNLQQELPVDAAYRPVYVAGVANAPRSYAISQALNGGPGEVTTIENTTNATIDPNPIPVGRGPVYGVMTADGRRVFVMNKTDGTVSVINAQTNLLDAVPAGSTNPIQVGTAPVWADFAPTRNELVVANAGDGVNPGSVSIINIPLCSATSLPSNPNCNPNNPVDAIGFGNVIANIPVGVNPLQVGVLQDGTRAYVVNGGNAALPCGPPTASQPLGNCTVSVINLTTNTVTATIPLVTTTAPVTPGVPPVVKNGHPNYIAVTTGTPTGKVYVTSQELTTMTVIRTDIDAVDTTVPLQGQGISVRVTAP